MRTENARFMISEREDFEGIQSLSPAPSRGHLSAQVGAQLPVNRLLDHREEDDEVLKIYLAVTAGLQDFLDPHLPPDGRSPSSVGVEHQADVVVIRGAEPLPVPNVWVDDHLADFLE